MGMTAVDMQDIEKTKLNEEQVFIAHGVPLSVAGVREAANFATSKIDRVRFKEFTVAPICGWIGETITNYLIKGFDQRLSFAFNVEGLINVTEIVQDFTPLFDRGVISINELRKKVGLPEIDEPMFNSHFITAGLVPLDLAGIADFGKTENAARSIADNFVMRSIEGNRLTPVENDLFQS